MQMADLKLNDRQSIDEQINAFFQRGGQIQEVPTTVYKREEVSQTARRTMEETSVSKLKAGQKLKHGGAMKEYDKRAWKLKELAGK